MRQYVDPLGNVLSHIVLFLIEKVRFVYPKNGGSRSNGTRKLFAIEVGRNNKSVLQKAVPLKSDTEGGDRNGGKEIPFRVIEDGNANNQPLAANLFAFGIT